MKGKQSAYPGYALRWEVEGFFPICDIYLEEAKIASNVDVCMMQETTIPDFSNFTPNFNSIIGFVNFKKFVGPFTINEPLLTFDCVVDDVMTQN